MLQHLPEKNPPSNQITERITMAQQTAALLTADLEQAFSLANAVTRPEGSTLGDKALIAYIAELMAAARQLESRLLSL